MAIHARPPCPARCCGAQGALQEGAADALKAKAEAYAEGGLGLDLEEEPGAAAYSLPATLRQTYLEARAHNSLTWTRAT
jgi:hypothetical protein